MLDIQKNIQLAPFTTYNIGGPADFFCKAESSQDLILAVSLANEKRLPFFVLGAGANILVGDKGYRGLVIKNESRNHSEHVSTSDGKVLFTVESGAIIADLIDVTIEKGLSGVEHFAGIPSTLGGALWQNLHFLSPDRKSTVFIGDIVESAEILPQNIIPHEERNFNETSQSVGDDKKIIKVGRDYFRFGYDYSSLHDAKDVVVSATLLLTPEDKNVLKQRVEANLLWRQEKHPENAVHSSAGSVFKKIEGYGAGRLIEQVGLKGKQIGGAKISEKHANFIINTGRATAQDVRSLISLVQQTVKEKLHLDLQTEISFIGEF